MRTSKWVGVRHYEPFRYARIASQIKRRPMGNDHAAPRRVRRWQFSLKSLMFLTLIVALCAGLVSISPALAIVVVPYVVAAAARTSLLHVRSVDRDQDSRAAPGLLVTFGQSLLLLIALTLVCIAALAGAGMAAALIVMTFALRVLAAASVLVRACAPKARCIASAVWREGIALVRRTHPSQILKWVRAQAVAVTAFLFALIRVLFRRCWCAEGATQPTRTEPL